MKAAQTFGVEGDEKAVAAKLIDFLAWRGWRIERLADGRISARRGRRGLASWVARIENLPARMGIRLGDVSGEDGLRCVVALEVEVDTRFRLVTRVDRLHYELEIRNIVEHVRHGTRPAPGDQLAPLRRPIAAAVLANAIISTALIVSVAFVAGLPAGATALVAAGVVLVNTVSIVGFADVVAEGMEAVLDGVRSRR